MGHIPDKDHPLSEFAPLLNYHGRLVPAGIDILEDAEEEKKKYLEQKRSAMRLLTGKIQKKQPGALLYWFRGTSKKEWSEEMRPEYPVLEEYPATGGGENF
jgi:hypothetical protein